MIPFKGTIDLSTKFDLMPLFRYHFRLNPRIAIRFRPDSISIQGPAGEVNAKNGVKCIATTTIPLSSMRKYNYDCNGEEVTVWLPCHIVHLKGFKAFIINISPAPRNDSESDYSRVEISISMLEERREPIVCILKELFPIMENEKERIICNFEGMATWANNCNYFMYNPESLMSDTPVIQNMSGAYYNRRMNTTVIYNYDALNNHIDGSEIVEVSDGKLRIGSLETGLLTIELNENSGNYRFPFEYIRKLNKFLGQRRSKVRVEFGVPFRSGNRPGLTPLCFIAREKCYTTFLVAAQM